MLCYTLPTDTPILSTLLTHFRLFQCGWNIRLRLRIVTAHPQTILGLYAPAPALLCQAANRLADD